MNEQALKKATGFTTSEWYTIIREAGKAEASHKEIAYFLHQAHGVSSWWAQEITVEYEKHTGRRVLGQSQDGSFQIGVSRTVAVPADRVWNLLQSAEGIHLVTSDPAVDPPAPPSGSGPKPLEALESLEGRSASGIWVATTTYEPGSHVRMRWRLPGWQNHSILQIRITPKSATKTTLSFHQEKLPSRDERAKMQAHWRRVSELMTERLTAVDPGSD
jgi:uncharacterized protein YndB with AHSA1/START domain